jgi:hypothetical protein
MYLIGMMDLTAARVSRITKISSRDVQTFIYIYIKSGNRESEVFTIYLFSIEYWILRKKKKNH